MSRSKLQLTDEERKMRTREMKRIRDRKYREKNKLRLREKRRMRAKLCQENDNSKYYAKKTIANISEEKSENEGKADSYINTRSKTQKLVSGLYAPIQEIDNFELPDIEESYQSGTFEKSVPKIRLPKMKPRDFWKDEEVMEMISIIGKNYMNKFLDINMKRNTAIYRNISKDLAMKHIFKSPIQICKKYKRLRSEYFKIRRKKNLNGIRRRSCIFFNKLNDVFNLNFASANAENYALQIKSECVEELVEDQHSFETFSDVMLDDTPTLGAAELPISSTDQVKIGNNYKNRNKHDYKTLDSFANELKDNQNKLIETLKQHDNDCFDRVEKLFEKNVKAMQKVLEEDRRETGKIFQTILQTFQTNSINSYPTFLSTTDSTQHHAPILTPSSIKEEIDIENEELQSSFY